MKRQIIVIASVILLLQLGARSTALQLPTDAPRTAPKFVLVFRERDPIGVEHRLKTEAKVFQTLDEAIAFAEDSRINEESFVGIWQLGEPLRVSVSTQETVEAVPQKKTKRVWKKPPTQ
jgi:hypothetical protein